MFVFRGLILGKVVKSPIGFILGGLRKSTHWDFIFGSYRRICRGFLKKDPNGVLGARIYTIVVVRFSLDVYHFATWIKRKRKGKKKNSIQKQINMGLLFMVYGSVLVTSTNANHNVVLTWPRFGKNE